MVSVSEIWPIHFQPKSDELLSSWLARLAIAYSLNYWAFTQAIAAFASAAKTASKVRRDWDIFASPDTLNFLAKVTATPIQSIEGAMLLPVSATTFVLSPYWFLSASGIQYCPSCLAADQVPYFRREWRIAFITCCETHETLLADSCPKCGASISGIPSRHMQKDVGVYVALRHCHTCQANLSDHRNAIPPSVSDLEFHQQLRRAIKQGWIDLPGGYRVVAQRYLAGLQIVTHRLTIGKSAQILQQALITSFESNKPSQEEVPIVSCQINRLNLEQRRVILHLLWKLIRAWPATSVKCANNAKAYNKFLFREEQLLNTELCRAFLGNESDDTKQFT